MILLLDNFDSFTYNLVDYFEQAGVSCKVIRNDQPLTVITSQEYSGVVLSPGPEIPEKAGVLMEVIDYYQSKLPLLGICLGHQAIGQYFGARLIKAPKPMHGKLSTIYCKQDELFKDIPDSFKVVRYNSLLIDKNSEEIKYISATDAGEVMAIRHNELPIWGVQFHPEAALSEFGLKILKNWLDYNNITG